MAWRQPDDRTRLTEIHKNTLDALTALDIATAESRAADWRDGTHQRAASLDPKVAGGDPTSPQERHADTLTRNPGSRVWTARTPWTDNAYRELSDAVRELDNARRTLTTVTARILAEPNPDALGRQTQLVACANPACDVMLDPSKGEMSAGRCAPCAEHRRTHNLTDRTATDIREAKGNRTAGPCDHPDCGHRAEGTDDDKLRPHPTIEDVRLCTRHWWQAKRAAGAA